MGGVGALVMGATTYEWCLAHDDFLNAPERNPEAAKRARHHYSCFEHFGKEIETYGYAAGLGLARTCEDASAGCGPVADGCGGVLQCGECTTGTCGGGGVPPPEAAAHRPQLHQDQSIH